MEKLITARHFSLREEAKSIIRDDLEQVHQEFPRVQHVRVILDLQKGQFLAEIMCHAMKQDFTASAKDYEPIPAFRSALEKLLKQMRRHIQKVKDHNHQVPVSQLECVMEEIKSEEEPVDSAS